jgi:hypothetical protein
MRQSRRFVTVLAVAAAGAATAQPAQKVTGPVATYWVSAQTQSGFAMPGMGGGRPDRGSMMRMMMGGAGGGAQHLLTLQLGSSRHPQGDPEAEHLPPQGLRAGASLPLVTPRAEPAQRVEEEPALPRDYQRPHGRMLIFWGCGEHARPNQPVVIDFSKLASGQAPPAFLAAMRGLGAAPMQPPSPGRNATYGEWPNERARASVPAEGSLVGAHTVRSDYAPEIRFNLAANQDFLAPLTFTTNARTPGGAVQLAWTAVPNATAYFASVIGGGQDTVVFWTSAEMQAAAFAAPDYLSPAEAARLVGTHALLSPQTTRCAVPKEVSDAAPHAMLQLTALGPEANFVYPPKPADPKAVWNKEWQVKVRYRSATGGMLGMAMPGMEAQEGGGDGRPPESRRGGMMRGLGGALGMGVPGL